MYEQTIGELRRAALARGQVRFDPGRPCRAGHHAPRYALSGRCVECQRETERQWRARRRQAKGHEAA